MKKILESLENARVVIAFDGWKNSVTKDAHQTFIIFEIFSRRAPIYWKSFVKSGQSAERLCEQISNVISELRENNIEPVAIIADNARSCQAAIKRVCEDKRIAVEMRSTYFKFDWSKINGVCPDSQKGR